VTRQAVINQLADCIVAVRRSHPIRVAIDGVDAAGKTILADELALVIQARGRPTIRATIDGFLRPRAERLLRGPDSPEGYYYDSFDYDALLAALLQPLGPDGDRHYRRAVFDYRRDTRVEAPIEVAPADSVLLVEGIFLQRPDLVHLWEYRIFVDVNFSVTLRRAVSRDLQLFGSAASVRERYTRRYIPGQRLYLADARPRERADVVVKNHDPARPLLILSLGQKEDPSG
jgi:uridine kinase